MRLQDKASVAYAANQGNWKYIIRLLLLQGRKRFNRLLDSLERVSSKVLSQHQRAFVGCRERRFISQRPRQPGRIEAGGCACAGMH